MLEEDERQEVDEIYCREPEDEEDSEEMRAAKADLVRSRADVVRYAGCVGVSMLPLITILSFADSVLNHKEWHGEAAIAAGCVTALTGIVCWAFNTREGRGK